ncbi:hypothetical protein BBC27_09575 [Acidithiobacillus ferrivorans]|uniref:Uncharacterized protein n=1 Tax=Acidithiobacillus ferrivorans TaxID=160808 RepID=A0A1B9BZD5_9PROT|nr:hypothetical protein [Acidithiobacillus ferrivorans]OCB03089.1 hypothetical protein BBC27_09575 [Acidithiobacillus ferrivorans]
MVHDVTKLVLTLRDLATLISGQFESVRNAFYLHPEDFPPVLYIPGCRGPRFRVSDIPDWLESRKKAKPSPASPPPAAPKPQGRPRKASASQIARARQGGAV